MRKSDIETRYDRRAGYIPCINIKLYRGRDSTPEVDADDIAEHFGCDRDTAERAAEYCQQSAQEQFWEQLPDTAAEILPGCEVYSDGRSGGWLIVHGLPDVETWDAVMLGKWAKLCRIVREEIKYLCSRDYIIEQIEANEWAKPHAELYNFISKDGQTVCLADLKAQAIAAGFGPVVRA